ncbi:MAG: aldehyde dehydrogenase family protein [Bradyrhizobium sp.]
MLSPGLHRGIHRSHRNAQKIAPALAAGNAIVLKPASWSPLVCLAFARIVEAAGLPPGIFSTLPGAGSIVGDRLVTHPAIKKVSFTGGTEVGRGIARKASEKLMPVSLELGGKSPTIVFADADIDLAIAGVLFGIFSSTGQSCIAGSRLFIERRIYDSFVARLVAAAKALRIGHSFDKTTQVAPLIHADHRDAVEAHIRRAREDGAEILAGGNRPEGRTFEQGVFFEPTILAGLDNTSRLCRDEVFGPVLAVLPFDDETDVIAQGNDNAYGLACGIYTRDFAKAWRVGRAIDAGTVWINTYKQFSIATPFGGVKDSGLGRGERTRRYSRLDGAKVSLCRHERRAASLGEVKMTEAQSQDKPDVLLDVRLRRIGWEADGVLALEFSAVDGGDLPPFEPGAHVDLHLGDGLLRQYSALRRSG